MTFGNLASMAIGKYLAMSVHMVFQKNICLASGKVHVQSLMTSHHATSEAQPHDTQQGGSTDVIQHHLIHTNDSRHLASLLDSPMEGGTCKLLLSQFLQ